MARKILEDRRCGDRRGCMEKVSALHKVPLQIGRLAQKSLAFACDGGLSHETSLF
jgi:hypothetical protein